MLRIINKIVEWFIRRTLKIEKELREMKETHDNFVEKLNEDHKLKVKALIDENSKIRYRQREFERIFNTINLEQGIIILDKKELLTSKMMMDMQKITNTDEYASLRQYLLNTTITLYDRTTTLNKEDAAMLCQFAMYVKSLVAEMDRMKTIDKAEQLPEDPYAV